MDCSLPGSSVHGIFQARVLEWGAIAFSGQRVKKAYKLMHKERKRIKDDIAVEDQRGEHLPLSIWYLSKSEWAGAWAVDTLVACISWEHGHWQLGRSFCELEAE